MSTQATLGSVLCSIECQGPPLSARYTHILLLQIASIAVLHGARPSVLTWFPRNDFLVWCSGTIAPGPHARESQPAMQSCSLASARGLRGVGFSLCLSVLHCRSPCLAKAPSHVPCLHAASGTASQPHRPPRRLLFRPVRWPGPRQLRDLLRCLPFPPLGSSSGLSTPESRQQWRLRGAQSSERVIQMWMSSRSL